MKLLDSSEKSQLFFLSDRALISFWKAFGERLKAKPKKVAKR